MLVRVLKIVVAAALAVLAFTAGAFVVLGLFAAFAIALLVRTLLRRVAGRRAAPSRRPAPATDDVIDITATEVPPPKQQ